MSEIMFLVEQAAEGGYIARALVESILTEADDIESLHQQVRDTVRCYFEENQMPRSVRLSQVTGEGSA